jgi:hypothetical protein
MAQEPLTGLQRRAAKFIDKRITYQKSPGDKVTGTFIGFDKVSTDRAVIQLSNAADRMTVPLMYVVSYFENVDDLREELE